MCDWESTDRQQPFVQDVSIVHTDIHLIQLYAYVSSAFISDMKNLVGRSSVQCPLFVGLHFNGTSFENGDNRLRQMQVTT
jgi:hypothetical protein